MESFKERNDLTIDVDDNTLNSNIISLIGVIRPLNCPSTNTKYGKVLSHSGIIAQTSDKYVLIEYMNDNKIKITEVDHYEPDKEEFIFQNFHFRQDPNERKPLEKKVKIFEFAETMANFMKDEEFDTFYHNCHKACRLTLKYYGISPPKAIICEHNILFQGIIDYYTIYNDNKT